MRYCWLRNDQWEKIKELLPGKASDRGVTARDNRKLVEAVLWIARTGSPRRDLPEFYGHWHSVYVRYSRWSHKSVWLKIKEELSKEDYFEKLLLRGGIVRINQHEQQKKQLKMSKSWGNPGVD